MRGAGGAAGAVTLVLIVAACGPADSSRASPVPSAAASEAASEASTPAPPGPAKTPPSTTASGAPSSPPAGQGTRPTGADLEDIGLASFADPTTIDNPWIPLVPGTRWTWEGEANGEAGRVPRRVVLVATDLVKEVAGVRTVVAYERDFGENELIEAELVFFAQADDGTVWHLGQYPEEYEAGVFVDAPTWIAGLRDAKAGILMLAEPRDDEPSYSQGWGPEVDWTDRGRVLEARSRTCVPTGCYDDVLVVQEYSRDEPDAHQLKYYAPGVGNVRVGWAGALEKEQEILELVRIEQLDAAELADVRAEALALEKHAYEVSPDVYGQTKPIEVPA